MFGVALKEKCVLLACSIHSLFCMYLTTYFFAGFTILFHEKNIICVAVMKIPVLKECYITQHSFLSIWKQIMFLKIVLFYLYFFPFSVTRILVTFQFHFPPLYFLALPISLGYSFILIICIYHGSAQLIEQSKLLMNNVSVEMLILEYQIS